MRFIINSENENHQTEILKHIKINDEIFFAVAFLKVSGLEKLISEFKKHLKANKRITIIAGQNFGLTEPAALIQLHNLFKKYSTSKLYIAKANFKNCIFHPKLYLFKSNDNCTVISGSANFTAGGLITNRETSLLIHCKSNDKIWHESKTFFDELISRENADIASLLIIRQYQSFFEAQKKHNKNSKAIPSKTNSQINFNYVNLLKHFNEIDNKSLQEKFKFKLQNYKIAKEILNKIADDSTLTRKKFEALLDRLVGKKGESRLWDSGSLFRLRRKVYPYFKDFQNLIIYIRANKNNAPEIVFQNAKRLVGKIDGAAVNYMTEIMMTYNIKSFANINRNPITVLKNEAGIKMKAHSSSYNGSDYKEYCELIKEISNKLNLENMLQADSLFNEIYWKMDKIQRTRAVSSIRA